MNGYEYLLERNRLMFKLEEDLAHLRDLPSAERQEKTARLQGAFDIRLAELYAKVANEFPGERRKKARPWPTRVRWPARCRQSAPTAVQGTRETH